MAPFDPFLLKYDEVKHINLLYVVKDNQSTDFKSIF